MPALARARSDRLVLPQSGTMHLIIPYAHSHEWGHSDALTGLHLPHLRAALALLHHQHTERDTDPTPPHMPHERLHASALGWQPPTPHAALPWAAWTCAPHDPAPQAWMTPCHWQIGMDQVVMADPDHLHLSDTESQQLLQAMQPFLQEDGLQVTWHSALLWHAQGALLSDVVGASLDRVIGHNVQHWQPSGPAARPLQRLQSEMQMLLYNHPVNNARDARRQHTVNAFWLHGTGALPGPHTPPEDAPTTKASVPSITVTHALRTAALHGDVKAWQQAWQTLDATTVADLLQHIQTTGTGTLSLCSQHTAHTYTTTPLTWHQRITRLLRPTSPATALQTLIQ